MMFILQIQRAVMDLPTTDPGSDLCDLTDSADESFLRNEEREYEGKFAYTE